MPLKVMDVIKDDQVVCETRDINQMTWTKKKLKNVLYHGSVLDFTRRHTIILLFIKKEGILQQKPKKKKKIEGLFKPIMQFNLEFLSGTSRA